MAVVTRVHGGLRSVTLTRGPALAVGLGLVWSLVVETLLRGVAGLLGPLDIVTNLLPGSHASATCWRSSRRVWR